MKKEKMITPKILNYVAHKIAKKALKKQKGAFFDDIFYDHLKKEFWNGSFGECLKEECTTGNCYFYALFLAKAMKNSTLKIGKLNKLNMSIEDAYYETFDHSWVEYGNTVFDTTLKMAFDKDFYYENYGAEIKESYEHDELENSKTFFKLGLNAVYYRNFLFDKFYKVVKDDYISSKAEYDKLVSEYKLEKLFEKACQSKENIKENKDFDL